MVSARVDDLLHCPALTLLPPIVPTQISYTFVIKPKHKDPVSIAVAIPGGAARSSGGAIRAPGLLPVFVGGEQSAPGSQ